MYDKRHNVFDILIPSVISSIISLDRDFLGHQESELTARQWGEGEGKSKARLIGKEKYAPNINFQS